MELLLESLKMELNELESKSEEKGNIIKFEDLIHQIDDSYEPDYYEEDVISKHLNKHYELED